MTTSHKRDNTPSRESGNLASLVHDYIEDVEITGRSPLTVRRYSAYLEVFLEWLAFVVHKETSELSPADITEERLREYRLFLARRRDPDTGRPIAPGTRNLYAIALRNLLRYLIRQRRVAVPDPDDNLQLARERDVEIRHLGDEEFARLREAVELSKPNGIRDRTIIEVLFGTAVRVSELAALKIRQVDLSRREAQVIGKGGRSRLVLFTSTATRWLERYLRTRRDDDPALFVRVARGRIGPLSVRQIQRVVDHASTRAGLPFRVSPHWLRHSRLTRLARYSGVQVAQRIAGHTSLATTSRYLHVSDPELREMFDKADADEP